MAWAPDYLTVDELKSYERIDDDVDNAELTRAIATASRAIDQATGRQFGKTDAPEARYFTAEFHRRRQRWVITIDDVMTVDDLVIKFDTADDATYAGEIDHYQLKPVNALQLGEPWTQIVVHPSSAVRPSALDDAVEVTATFGWLEVPESIKQACALQASRFAARRDSPYGIAGSPDQGSELRLLAKLDPDVITAVRPFLRLWVAT